MRLGEDLSGLPVKWWRVVAGQELCPPRHHQCGNDCPGPTRYLFRLGHVDLATSVTVCRRCAGLMTGQRHVVGWVIDRLHDAACVRLKWGGGWRVNDKGNYVKKVGADFVTVFRASGRGEDGWGVACRGKYHTLFATVEAAKEAAWFHFHGDPVVEVPHRWHRLANPCWEGGDAPLPATPPAAAQDPPKKDPDLDDWDSFLGGVFSGVAQQ